MSQSPLCGYRCWDTSQAQEVLDVDALSVPAGVFRAVHQEVPLRRTDSLGTGTGSQSYSEEQLVGDLLDPSVSYVLAAVTGASGCGKSHLIRWLFHQIEETDGRKVLLVPRAGTNLRGVLQLILQGMVGEEFEEYRRRLAEADDGVPVEVSRGRLLDRLAERVEHGNETDLLQALPGHSPQHLMWVRQSLPVFLRDAVFREEWLKEEGGIATIHDIALGTAESVDRATERRGLRREDLPLQIDPRKVADASRISQSFYNLLIDENNDVEGALLDVANYYLDEALQAILRVGASDLSALLRAVRVQLAEQGKELILLIEDVARLQGIDLQLLDALLERPRGEGSQDLCNLRAVVGSTTGYFRTLPDTFRTRCSFRIEFPDRSIESEREVVTEMAARYLNAARVGAEGLQAWAGDVQSEAPPNRCEVCQHREECHSAFGESSGVGFYPLNRMSVLQAYDRSGAVGINPRFLISDVIRRTVVAYADDISSGDFPNTVFLSEFGQGEGVNWLGANVISHIERSASSNLEADRYRALVELWSDRGDLPRGVFEAYGLRPLELSGVLAGTSGSEATTDTSPDPVTRRSARVAGPEDRISGSIAALDRWAAGGELPQDVVTEMRNLVFEGVKAHIDWDSQRLLESRLSPRSGTTQAFGRTSLNFERQAVAARTNVEVTVLLPLEGKMSESDLAQALQGLVRYSAYGSWEFPKAQEALILVARFLSDVADSVVAQLRHPAGVPFDQAVAAAELLSLGAALHGLPSASQSDVGSRVNAWYSDWSEVSGGASWSRLALQFRNHQSELQNMLESYCICSKGGSVQTKWLDVVQFDSVLRRRSLLPESRNPEGGTASLPRRYRPIGTLLQACEQLTTITQEEASWWSEWHSGVQEVLQGSEFAAFREQVNKTRKKLSRAGVGYLRQTRESELESLSRSLASNDVDRVLHAGEQVDSLSQFDSRVSVLSVAYANSRRVSAEKLANYLATVVEMADRSEDWLQQQIAAVGGGDAAHVHSTLKAALETLLDSLDTPGETDAATHD